MIKRFSYDTITKLKVGFIFLIAIFAVALSSCEDDPIVTPSGDDDDDDCTGSYCKLDRGSKDMFGKVAVLYRKNPETF